MKLLGKEFKFMFFSGSALNLFVFFAYGYDGTLPTWLDDVLSQPISHLWFISFSGLCYLFWAGTTMFGSKPIPNDSKRKWVADNVITPMLSVTHNFGVPMLGYFLGSAMPAMLMHALGFTDLDAYSALIATSFILTSVLCNLHIIKLYMAHDEYKFKVLLLIFMGHIVLGFALRFGANDNFLKASGTLCLLMALLVCVTMYFNIATHPDSITKRLRQTRNARQF
ncbi:hypothetical protein [Vibrio owensii]|uniref:hypothetical protein n=1 Tax=Vibrio owensii TaxID=696485 RepID=UPI002FF24E9C